MLKPDSAAGHKTPPSSSEAARDAQRQYWNFYWPLLLWSASLVVARQLQNGVLAYFDPGGREVAILAYATSVYWIPQAALGFVPQMVNALGRSRPSRRVCFLFTGGVCLLFTIPLLLTGFTPSGRRILALTLGIRDAAVLNQVVTYLQWLCPMILLNGLRHYYVGLLVQARRTGIVAGLNMAHVPLVATTLGAGVFLGWKPLPTILLAQIAPLALQTAASWVLFRVYYRRPVDGEAKPVTYAKTLMFFWPVALTGVMFATSRPIIYSFVNRLPDTDPTPIVGALRIGFDLAMLFQMASNQFRHVFVTFGVGHLPGLRKLMFRVVAVVTGLMLAVALTPLQALFFGRVLGLASPVREYAGQVLLAMCAVPTLIAWRNYHHGLAMIRHRTVGMGIGGVARNATALLLSWAMLGCGWLKYPGIAALVLVMGFTAEAATVTLSTRRWRREEAVEC